MQYNNELSDYAITNVLAQMTSQHDEKINRFLSTEPNFDEFIKFIDNTLLADNLDVIKTNYLEVHDNQVVENLVQQFANRSKMSGDYFKEFCKSKGIDTSILKSSEINSVFQEFLNSLIKKIENYEQKSLTFLQDYLIGNGLSLADIDPKLLDDKPEFKAILEEQLHKLPSAPQHALTNLNNNNFEMPDWYQLLYDTIFEPIKEISHLTELQKHLIGVAINYLNPMPLDNSSGYASSAGLIGEAFNIIVQQK
ncbi:MAG: hypothetical protein RCG15_05800 [Candidatus Rickettsia vulgarisii]